MPSRRTKLSFALLCFLIDAALSTVHGAPALRATPLSGAAPVIDGRLDEPVWKSAELSSAFTQKFPLPGQPPTEPTTVRVLYDGTALYFGIECVQRQAAVQRRLTRRDRETEADWVSVSLDSRRDGTTAFEFAVNAAGVLSDRIRFNDTEESIDWDEIWDGQAAITPTGWSVEFRIPLRSIRFDIVPSQSFGLQVRRYVSQRQETDEWVFIPRSAGGEVSRYGRLTGLDGLRRGGWLELRPFLVTNSGWTDLDLHSPDLKFGGSAGVDIKARLTQNLVLDATINPDFGQVEADQAVLNLTTFEVYYPEKRPFFLEGIDTFRTQLQLFYSRRVGYPPPVPELRVDAPYHERLLQAPAPTPIYAAAKLLGTVGRRMTIGGFSALLGKAEAVIKDAGRRQLLRVAEPLKLQSVLRLKIAIGDNAHMGLTGTAVNRFEFEGDAPPVQTAGDQGTDQLCPSGDKLPLGSRCFHDAYVAAIDGRWRSKDGNYALNAQLLLSAIVGGPPRTMRDGTVIASGDVAPGAIVQASKEGGEHFTASVGGHVLGPKLDFNDLGYMTRQNEYRVYAIAEYRTMKPWQHTLETHTHVDVFYRGNFSGLPLVRGGLINTSVLFRNFWSLGLELSYDGSIFDDREVGDGTALERADRVSLAASVSTDRRKRVFSQLSTYTQFIRTGFNFTMDGEINLRILPRLDLQILPQAQHTFGEPRYVGAGFQSGVILFGRLRATSLSVTLRAIYTITQRLTIQAYGQLLVSTKHYEDFLSYQAAPDERARPVVHLCALQPATAPAYAADTAAPTLNLSAVLRWEYLPGSVLFVVYSRSQLPTLTYHPGQEAILDLAAFKSGPAHNMFLVKWSYWYG